MLHNVKRNVKRNLKKNVKRKYLIILIDSLFC